jgi:hypothetical protein
LLLPSGNIGIATTNPSGYKLNVNGSTYVNGVMTINANIQFGTTNGNNLTLVDTNGFFSTSATAGDMVLRSINNLLILSGTGTPSITINAANYVGIGTAASATYILNVDGSINSTSLWQNGTQMDFSSYATNTNLTTNYCTQAQNK